MRNFITAIATIIFMISLVFLGSDSESATTFLIVHFISAITFILSGIVLIKLQK